MIISNKVNMGWYNPQSTFAAIAENGVGMNDGFVEQLIKRKGNTGDTILFAVLMCFAVLTFLAGLMMAMPLVWFATMILGLLAYIVKLRSYVEYEYTYIEKELTIDKIYNMARRKKGVKINLETMEICAIYSSHELDSYKNRTGRTIDYSSGFISQPETRYMIVADGGQRYIIEPNEDLLACLKNVSPRKFYNY